jgi:hypothetical protein
MCSADLERTVSDATVRVRDLAARLGRVSAPDEDSLSLVGFAIGAAYSLQRAIELGAEDSADFAEYRATLSQAAHAVSQGNEPPPTWLAKYYLNACATRLDAVVERIGKYPGPPSLGGKHWRPAKYDLERIHEDVNDMKHEIGSFFREGRRATVIDAERVLGRVVAGLEHLFGDSDASARPPNDALQQTRHG